SPPPRSLPSTSPERLLSRQRAPQPEQDNADRDRRRPDPPQLRAEHGQPARREKAADRDRRGLDHPQGVGGPVPLPRPRPEECHAEPAVGEGVQHAVGGGGREQEQEGPREAGAQGSVAERAGEANQRRNEQEMAEPAVAEPGPEGNPELEVTTSRSGSAAATTPATSSR